MLSHINAFLRDRSSFQVIATALVLVCVLAFLDQATGYELSFSIFYLLPVSLATWYAGLVLGGLLSIVSAAIWIVADLGAGHPYSHGLIPFWNAGVRFLFFIITAGLLSTVRSKLELEKRLARLDSLTGVFNRHAFTESAQAILRVADRFNRPVALGFIDLDNFKRLNDSYGHSEGDRVLESVASILLGSVRKADVVGRWGGDEFVVLLPETTGSGAMVVFEELRGSLLKMADARDWPSGFSIGVAVFPKAPESVSEAVKSADALMYRVKKSGKNKILFEAFGESPESGMRSEVQSTSNPRREPS